MHIANSQDAWAKASVDVANALLEPTVDKNKAPIPNDFKHIIRE